MAQSALASLQRLQQAPEDAFSTNEKNFICSAASEKGIRLDGRGVNEPRTCEISVRTVARSKSYAECVLGGATKASCTVSIEVSLPYPDRPNEGILSMQTDYMHSAGNRSNQVLDLVLLERSIQRAIDVESLCIVPGLRVWMIKCHIMIANDCGSIMDACSLAACAALLHFRRPDVTVVGEEVIIHGLDDRMPVPLSMHYAPACVSFALLDTTSFESKAKSDEKTNQGYVALADPTEREEKVAEGGMLQVFLNAHREICGLSEGGPLLPRSAFTQMLDIAGQIRVERGTVLDQAVLASPF